MDPKFAQRFQYRPPSKALLLNAPGIAAYALFRMTWLMPLAIIIQQFRRGYHPQQLWWLLSAPMLWLLAHALWRASDVIFFHVNRDEARRDDRGFFLLLRPFKQTAATAIPGAVETPDVVGHILRGTHSLVWQYGFQLAPVGRVVTVGKMHLPKPVVSNDTVSVLAADHNWMELVKALAERCRAIILLFDEGSGILDEIRYLSEAGLTNKTIIRVAPIQPLARDPAESQRRWNEARAILVRQGLNPPEATPEGFLYIPKPDFSILHKAELRGGTENALNRLIALIPHARTECSLRETMRFVDSFETRTFAHSA